MVNIFLTYLGISASVGIAIFIILLASSFINRRYAAKWKYFIWIFLAVRLLLPVSGMYHKKADGGAANKGINSSGTVVYESTEVQTVQPRRFVVKIPVETAEQTVGSTGIKTGKAKPSLFDIAFAAWLAGAVLFAAAPVLSCLHYKHQIIKNGENISKSEAAEMTELLKSELGIGRKVRLIKYSAAPSPMIIGFIRPVLVLPGNDYSPDELYFIIRHELIHLKRGDVYVKLLCVLANAVHWFNPLVWIMRREAAVDMELSCDEGVVNGADFGTKKAYTETLLSSLHRQSYRRSALTTQFYGGKNTMKKRFTNILSKGRKKNGLAVLICAVIMATFLGVMVGCTQKQPSQPEVNVNPDSDTNPDINSDPQDLQLANDIVNQINEDYSVTVDILTFDMTEEVWIVNGVDQYGNVLKLNGIEYAPLKAPYDTLDGVMSAMHKVYSDRMCDEIEKYISSSNAFAEQNGKLYCQMAYVPYGGFNMPFTEAVRNGDTLTAYTTVSYDDGDYPFSVVFVLENDVWKIDEMFEDGQEVISRLAGAEYDYSESVTTEKALTMANEIFAGLESHYRTTVDILTMNYTEPMEIVEGVDILGNIREIDGVSYVPMKEEFDTIDKIMSVVHTVYTAEKSATLYSQYFDENNTGFMKTVDGKLYAMATGYLPYTDFNLPFTSAERISDTEIVAKTVIAYDSGDVPYEVTFKNEGGQWKIAKLVEYVSDEGREVSY